ncbi:MAG TPA: hypothetical protein VMM92_06595, partial [Thermoanaerobaculia bacterium]|nr:hypothetical protein [Thermoanaerobaculia bacterium]
MRSTKSLSWIRSLFGFSPLAVPPHVFDLAERRLRYGQFVRAGNGFRFRAFHAVPLPPDAFLSGPLGGPLRDPRAFQASVAGLIKEIAGVRDASLVIPDAWLRVSFTDSGELPRSGEAREEILRWKLKRLVPFRVDELRIGAQEVEPLPGQSAEEPRRLLLGFAVEHLLEQLEEAFAASAVRLGQITNTSLSLISALGEEGPEPGFWALVVVEEAGYTLAFVRGSEPILHRFKAFTGSLPEAARASLVTRDLKLTKNFLDEHYPGADLSRVLLAAPEALEPIWIERLRDGLG